MILPANQARASARGDIKLIHVPAQPSRTTKRPGPRGIQREGLSATYETTPWAPVTGGRELIQSLVENPKDDEAKIETHATVVVGMWERTTLRPLLELTSDALALRKAAGHRLGNGIADLARGWMERVDSDWPPAAPASCVACRGTGRITLPYTGFPGEPHDPDGCDRCEGATWKPHTPKCPACVKGRLRVPMVQTDEEAVARFAGLHADRPVYAVLVTVDPAVEIRSLTPTARPRGNELGYIDGPADELSAGEAIPETAQTRISTQAREADALRRKTAGTGRDIKRAERNAGRYRRRVAPTADELLARSQDDPGVPYQGWVSPDESAA